MVPFFYGALPLSVSYANFGGKRKGIIIFSGKLAAKVSVVQIWEVDFDCSVFGAAALGGIILGDGFWWFGTLGSIVGWCIFGRCFFGRCSFGWFSSWWLQSVGLGFFFNSIFQTALLKTFGLA